MNLKTNWGSSMVRGFIATGLLVLAIPILFSMFRGAQGAKRSAEDALHAATVQTVTSALETYRAVNSEYPQALGALSEASEAYPAYVSQKSLQLSGYSYDYEPTPNDFALRLNPDSGKGEFYFADKSGQVRVSRNAPADAQSPLWSE